MTDFSKGPEDIVEDLINLLVDRYESGFSIFKELLQNADDAGAKRLLIAGHEGFAGARNPLVQAPSLIIANDGPVLEKDFAAIKKASGGGKADEAGKVGRFGLGQKSVFHFCDAFACLAWIQGDSGGPRLDILNPFEQIPGAIHAGGDWKIPHASDAQLLEEWARSNGLSSGMLLFVPLRSDQLSPGGELQISREKWTPASAIEDISREGQLGSALACLRHLRTVDIDKGNARLSYTLSPDPAALASPNDLPTNGPLGGSIRRGDELVARFSGIQVWKENGEAAQLKQRDDWPFRIMLDGKRVPEKAAPHGAVLAIRRPDVGPGSLRIHHAVYLPVGDAIEDIPLVDGSGEIDLLLHGCLFPASDRKRVLLGNEAHIQDRWNRLLLEEATLPLLLGATAGLMADLPEDAQRYGVIRALGETPWWRENAVTVCGGRALAQVWNGIGKPRWDVVEAASLRPLPVSASTGLERLKIAWPNLKDWCDKHGVSISFGAVLAEEPPQWRDSELAGLLVSAGAAPFTLPRVAETISTLLEGARGARGPLTQQALAASFREALAGDKDLAPADRLRELAAFLPADILLTLPKSVEKRSILAALASASPMLPMRDEWCAQPYLPALDVTTAIDLLSALEALLSQAPHDEQTAAAVNAVLRLGPDLSSLAANERARHLAVVPATRVYDKEPCRLSLGEIHEFARQGLLFGRQPLAGLDELAEAVIEPCVYRLNWRADDGFVATGSKQSDLVQVLKLARQFGSEDACGKLAARLCDHAGRDELRRLVARTSPLPDTARLLEVGDLAPVLAPLADELRRHYPADQVVSPSISESLARPAKTKIGIEPIDAALLGGWLLDALENAQWPSISDTVAEAVLLSRIEPDILRKLPLHRTTSGEWCAADDRLYIAHIKEVPPSLADHARLVDLWPDNAVQRVQRLLIPRWSEEAQIETALAAPAPHLHAEAIAAAISGTDPSARLIERLKAAAWLPVSGRGLSPSEILNLPGVVERALREAIAGEYPLATLADLPNSLRSEGFQRALLRSGLLLSQGESLELAGIIAAEAGIVGLAADCLQNIAAWRDLARGGHDLSTKGWPVLRAVLSLDSDPSEIASFVAQLEEPQSADAIAQLNGLARIVQGAPPQVEADAARRLHRQIYDVWQSRILIDGFLPADLMVPSRSGAMQRADALALEATGVEPGTLLDRHYAEGLSPSDAEIAAVDLPEPDRHEYHDRLKEELERFRAFAVPAEAILFLLAMLGRDAAITAIAGSWEEQRPFDRISDELDDLALALDLPTTDEVRNRVMELRFEIRSSSEGEIAVRSAAGGTARVRLQGDTAWLVDCIKLQSRRENGRMVHPYSLSLAPVTIADDDHARQLLEAFVERLAPVLQLGMTDQRLALLERFAACFLDNQSSLEEACNDLKRVIDDRLQGLKPGEHVRQALKEFNRNRHRQPQAATQALWDGLQSVDAAAELLAAVRQKIHEMGYANERVLFELFQNADDALEDWPAHTPGLFRVEARRDADGEIEALQIIHWGRPINHLGTNSELGRERGYGNDLANMLAINHSAKEGERQTGRFGLGFKTVHMLADEVRVASGRHIVTRIQGGMIPHPWPEGGAAAQPYRSSGLMPTVFGLPIASPCQEAAALALEAFSSAAPWLAAVAPRIGQIEIMDLSEESRDHAGSTMRHRASRREFVDGIAIVELSTGRRILEFALADGFRLFVAFGNSGPERVRDARQFWHLVPLDGIERRGGWVMEGRFPVDPGRTHLSGSHEDQERLFERLGLSLGARLVELYDALSAGWSSFARDQTLDPQGFDEFFQRLISLFALDLDSSGPESALHRPTRGLAYLVAQRPLIRLANGAMAKAGDVSQQLVGGLCASEVMEIAEDWPTLADCQAGLVDEESAALLRTLGFGNLRPVHLSGLMTAMIKDSRLSPQLAGQFAPLIADEILEWIDKSEEADLRTLLREVRWLAEDGSWQPIRLLAFPLGDNDQERLRAAFAPPAGRLSPEYDKDARAFAEFARAQAGHNEEVQKGWVASADASEARQLAVLQYLAIADLRATNVLASAAAWLPSGAALNNYPLLAKLDERARATLLARLGSAALSEPSRTIIRIDAAQALESIAEWWQDARADLTPKYDQAVYPDGFHPSQLHSDDDEAWFTMLALAIFHTIGRIKPDQSKSFVERARRAGWWSDLATVRHDDNLQPFADLLRRWTEPAQDEPLFWLWRRCLPDLCMVARYLEEYRRFFLKLPQVLAAHPKISLRAELRPQESQIWAQFGMNAGPIAQSMGLGANWTLRELARHGIYSTDHAARIKPLGWSTAARVRRLFEDLQLGPVEHGIDAGKLLYAQVADLIGPDEASFGGDGDLCLHLITTARHRETLQDILLNAKGIEWRDADYDDGEGSYEL